MKLTITTTDNVVYRFADKTITDDAAGVFRGRIENNIALSRSFSDTGSSLTSITIHLINHDRIVPDTAKLWNAKAELVTNNNRTWAGKITGYKTNSEDKLIITATELTAPELNKDLPDEFVRLVEIDENVHTSALNLTVPIVIGGTASDPIQIKGILKNKTNAIYYLCVGEIHEIINIRVGTEKLTRAEAEAKGYICYTGSPSQATEPGIAYIQITDPDLRKNDDGSYVEIGAEVIGLKLGNHTVEECRNGARFLYWLLKTASTGPCGWGLGIDDSEIDSDSFDIAISAVEAAGLKLDGVIYEQKTARNWITEICRAIRGNYEIGTDGKRRLFIQAPGSSEFLYTEANIELINAGVGAFTGRVYNKGRLNYHYNPFTGYFMQSADFIDSDSVAEIEEQEFIGNTYLIRDAATAQKILDYNCKNSLIAAYSISFSTMVLPPNCRVGTIVTVNHSKRGISGLFRITSLQIDDRINRIEAVKYDPSVFDTGEATAQVSWSDDFPISSSVQPAAPSGLILTQERRQAADGATVFVIKGMFELPPNKYLGASVEWGEGLLPMHKWNSLGLLQGNNFEISGLKNDTAYAVRVRMISVTGRSEYVTGTIMTESDNIPPGIPTITAKCFLKTVSLTLSLSSYPADMRGFIVFRNTVNNSGTAAQIGEVDSHKAAQFIDNVDDYNKTYYYWAKSVDVWGNQSGFGNVANITATTLISEDISASALKLPAGALLSLSAKNCTTESIALENGVKDVSGNGNHGQAFGGVEVINDPVIGACFKFDGVNDYILDNSITYENTTEFSVSVWAKKTAHKQYQSIYSDYYSGINRSVILGYEAVENRMYWYCGDGTNIKAVSVSNVFIQDEWAHWTGVFKGSEYMRLYKNGILIGELITGVPEKIAVSHYHRYFGRNSSVFFNGFIAHPKIYNRALTPAEIKTLYMFPGGVAFGQLTADLIGANVIKAQNLIQSEAIITNKAQINSGVFNEILVLDNNYIDTKTTADTALSNADAAQSTADTANTNATIAKNAADAASAAAATAQTAANTAAANAAAAITVIADMTNDNRLTPDEKQSTKKEWDIIVSEKTKNDAQADAFGVSKTAYGTAYSALSTYITPLLSNLTTTSDITGTTFRAKFKDYYDARIDLLNAISAKSKQVADAAQSVIDEWSHVNPVTLATEIKGGKITTGSIKSGSYIEPAPGEKFAQSGSSYDLDNATIVTENFYSDHSGAGIKGHVEADSGKIGMWEIKEDGRIVANVGNSPNESSRMALEIGAVGSHDNNTSSWQSLSVGRSILGSVNRAGRTYVSLRTVLADSETNAVIKQMQSDFYSDGLFIEEFDLSAPVTQAKLSQLIPAALVLEGFRSRLNLTNEGLSIQYEKDQGANTLINLQSLNYSGNIGVSSARNAVAVNALDIAGGLRVNDGTAAAPAISFSNDTNTGVYRSGTDAMAFVTAGVQRMNIAENGRVTLTAGLTVSASGLTVSAGGLNVTGGIAASGAVNLGSGGLTVNGYATSVSRAANGYMKFNGVIIAWGSFTSSPSAVVTFPSGAAFTAAPKVITEYRASGGNFSYGFADSITTTGFTCVSNRTGFPMSYIAIGY